MGARNVKIIIKYLKVEASSISKEKKEGTEASLTLCGAGSNAILALVMIPNCPKPPRTPKKSSGLSSSEQVTSSPFPD